MESTFLASTLDFVGVQTELSLPSFPVYVQKLERSAHIIELFI